MILYISCMRFVLVCMIMMLVLATSAQARTLDGPAIKWRFDDKIMQGNANTPTGMITDPDGDLVAVTVRWGDSTGTAEAEAITHWRAKNRSGVKSMPMDMDSLNDPCFNYTGKRTVRVIARDRRGHVARRSFTFTVTPDPDWPGPEVPVIGVSPGHDGILVIGIG